MKFGLSRKYFEAIQSTIKASSFCPDMDCKDCPFQLPVETCLKVIFNEALCELIEKYPKETCPTCGKEIEDKKDGKR